MTYEPAGTDPLEFLQGVMDDDEEDTRDRISCAKELAQYQHRKQRPTDNLIKGELPQITILMPTISSGQMASPKTIVLNRGK